MNFTHHFCDDDDDGGNDDNGRIYKLPRKFRRIATSETSELCFSCLLLAFILIVTVLETRVGEGGKVI